MVQYCNFLVKICFLIFSKTFLGPLQFQLKVLDGIYIWHFLSLRFISDLTSIDSHGLYFPLTFLLIYGAFLSIVLISILYRYLYALFTSIISYSGSQFSDVSWLIRLSLRYLE